MNYEVKLILTRLKIVSEKKENGAYICDKEHSKLLLSYIEQLEKENEFLKLDNPSANIRHFEMLKENKRKIDNLRYQKKQLENNRDKAIEYIKEHIKYECDDSFNGMQFYSYHLYNFNKEELLRMLGEIE